MKSLSVLTVAVLLAACSGSPDDSMPPSDDAAPAAEETAPESENARYSEVSPAAGLLNANLATEADLIAAMSKEVALMISDSRPFLTLTDLHETLLTIADEETASDILSVVSVPINLNTAPPSEMLLIPGVGDRMAREFDEYRPYVAIEQFRREIGKYVDDDELARLEQYVFVPINLNEATDEQILALPGVGNRMLHEFKEYRPYTNMEQFRREIGKYVDDAELARLERLVTL